MATLVNVTREGRLFLKVGGVIFAVLMVLFIFIRGGSMMRDLFFPKPPPPPVQEFGKLPKIKFPPNNFTAISYTVNTVDGQLPKFPDRVNIYKIKTGSPDLLALEQAKNTLDSENFVEGQLKITDTIYRWTQSDTGVVIEYNTVDHNFTISSNYLTNPNLVSTDQLPSEDSITSDIKTFLSRIKEDTDNLDFDNAKVEYLEQQGTDLVAAQNLGLARFARVTIPQNKIDDLETVYSNPEKSLTSFIVSYPDSHFTVLQGIFFNYQIDTDQKSDYPIKSPEQALEDLKAGNAFIDNPQNLNTVEITGVSLNYYLSKENYGYILPVYVFKGINFEAYVSALPDASIESTDPAGPQN